MEKYIFSSVAGDKTISMLTNQTPYDTSCHDIPSIRETALKLCLSAQSRFLFLPDRPGTMPVLYIFKSFFIGSSLRLFFRFSTHFILSFAGSFFIYYSLICALVTNFPLARDRPRRAFPTRLPGIAAHLLVFVDR
jgi:hypothetical protein